jgi:hypothetical protein
VELTSHYERKHHNDQQRRQGERHGGAEFAGLHIPPDDLPVKWLRRHCRNSHQRSDRIAGKCANPGVELQNPVPEAHAGLGGYLEVARLT